MLYKRTLPHHICACVIHENLHLLLKALPTKIDGLSNDLSSYMKMMVCDEYNERCMASLCDNCKGNFTPKITNNIIDKNEKIDWFQWITSRDRAIKKNFVGKSLCFFGCISYPSSIYSRNSFSMCTTAGTKNTSISLARFRETTTKCLFRRYKRKCR